MKCTSCGANVPKGRSMCPMCGYFLDDNSQPGLLTQSEEKKQASVSVNKKVIVTVAICVLLAFVLFWNSSLPAASELHKMVCSHEWSAPNCIAPQTCDKCGKTEGDVLDHTWLEATYSVPQTCSICGLTKGEPLQVQLMDSLRERLPIVTYAMSTETKLYGYKDAALTQKSNEYYFYPSGEEIVIVGIAEDNTAMQVRYPSTIAESGYRTMWFPAEEIVSLEEVTVCTVRSKEATETLRYSHVNRELVHYGTMAYQNRYLALGTHATGCTAIVYDINEKTKFDLTVGDKLALIQTAP